MPEKQISNYLIIDWKDESTRTRQTKPAASDLGTHELMTTLTLDVVIPEVDVDELHATVEVPTPRVEQTAMDDVSAEDAPDWMDVADEKVDDFLGRFGYDWAEWRDNEDGYTLRVIEDAPARPNVDDVKVYLRQRVRSEIQEEKGDD